MSADDSTDGREDASDEPDADAGTGTAETRGASDDRSRREELTDRLKDLGYLDE